MSETKHTVITPAQRDARSQNAAKATEAREQARAKRRAEALERLDAAGVPRYEISEARLMAAKAGIAELELAERRGELIEVERARADMIDKFTIAKMRVLSVPSRLAQQLPHLATEIVPVVDALLREALEELAARGDDERI